LLKRPVRDLRPLSCEISFGKPRRKGDERIVHLLSCAEEKAGFQSLLGKESFFHRAKKKKEDCHSHRGGKNAAYETGEFIVCREPSEGKPGVFVEGRKSYITNLVKREAIRGPITPRGTRRLNSFPPSSGKETFKRLHFVGKEGVGILFIKEKKYAARHPNEKDREKNYPIQLFCTGRTRKGDTSSEERSEEKGRESPFPLLEGRKKKTRAKQENNDPSGKEKKKNMRNIYMLNRQLGGWAGRFFADGRERGKETGGFTWLRQREKKEE